MGTGSEYFLILVKSSLRWPSVCARLIGYPLEPTYLVSSVITVACWTLWMLMAWASLMETMLRRARTAREIFIKYWSIIKQI